MKLVHSTASECGQSQVIVWLMHDAPAVVDHEMCNRTSIPAQTGLV
jgi:hypothetical protein